MNANGTITESEIQNLLAADHPFPHHIESYNRPYLNVNLRPAAVLIPLLRYTDHSWHILYTRRTNTVAEHKGQVAFPGGRKNQEDDSAQQTALREAFEEIGMNPKDVRILGELDSLPTVSNFRVVPIVGVIPWPYKFKPHPMEVERIFTLPLQWLACSENFTIRQREITTPGQSSPQVLEVIYYKPFDGETLWGVSADITMNLLERLKLAKRK
jgi:8-oxo-dGTP pyrophosphatase MutT (NUDIX family)